MHIFYLSLRLRPAQPHSYLCDEVASHGQVVLLHGVMEGRPARLDVRNVHVCTCPYQQLQHFHLAVTSSQVQRSLTYRNKFVIWNESPLHKRFFDFFKMQQQNNNNNNNNSNKTKNSPLKFLMLTSGKWHPSALM